MGESVFQDILIEDDDAVRTIYFDRERDMNRIRVRTLEELREALEDTHRGGRSRVLILTGKGRSFAAGVSLDEIEGLSRQAAYHLSRNGHDICSLLEEMQTINIAAINGFAFGGGSEIALACDIRIGSDRMRIGQPEVTLGIMPGFGATQRLRRIVGYGMAMDLILSGEIIDAGRALAMGLVSRIYPHATFEEERRRFAEALVRNAPTAQKLAKKAIQFTDHQPLLNGLDNESKLFARSFDTEEPSIGIRAFREKIKPEWPEDDSS